ncbi:MAG: HPP family protein [Gammaproteobacteria bacterium]
MRDLLHYFITEPVPITPRRALTLGGAVFVAMFSVLLVSTELVSGAGAPILVASMGASAVLLFAVPHSPLAQPWPFAGGHLISASIGITCATLIPEPALAAAAAVALAVAVMYLTHSLHPPGGAVALVPVLGDASIHQLHYQFLLTPVTINIMVMLFAALTIHNLPGGQRYPAPSWPQPDRRHKHRDPPPLERFGIDEADLHQALQEFDSFLDITESDLQKLYSKIVSHAARRRLGDITCADVMSRDLVTITADTPLAKAWALLRYHKIKALPVVDSERRVIGMVTLVDFLKRIDLPVYEDFPERLANMIRPSQYGYGPAQEKPEVVSQVMAAPVITVGARNNIVNLVPLLSDRGLHHVPIVDSDARLVGMVTQSDLIAALYSRGVSRGQIESSKEQRSAVA